MSPRANNSKAASKASGRAVVNDSPVDCQSREVTEGKFSAENLARTLVQQAERVPPKRVAFLFILLRGRLIVRFGL